MILPAVLLAGVLTAAAFVFEPWALWIDERVDEPLPTANPTPSTPREPGTPTPGGPSTTEADAGGGGPEVLAEGSFVSHEHATSGRVVVLDLGGDDRVLRIEDLDTSNGPDLEVWITDAPVISGDEGWHVFDDGDYVSLGRLKGNLGSQNYVLPESVDLRELHSVSIWCNRFNVSFGAAELA